MERASLVGGCIVGRAGVLARRLSVQCHDGVQRWIEPLDAGELQVEQLQGAQLALSQEAQKLAPRVRAPALLLHGSLDRTSAPAGSRKLARLLGSPRVDLRLLPHSGHVLPLDAEAAEVCRNVVSFFQGVA